MIKLRKLEYTKTSLHNHFGGPDAEFTRNRSNHQPKFDLNQAKEKIDSANGHGYQLLGMTNHNHLWKEEYEKLVKYIKNKSYDIFLIPGIELDIVDKSSGESKYMHVVVLLDPQSDLDDFKNKLENFILKNQENAIDIKQLTELASMQKSILIPHGNKQRKRAAINNIQTFDNILSIRDFFPIMIEDSTEAQRSILETKIRVHLTSSDFLWIENAASVSTLDQAPDFSQIKEPTYIWGEPTFDSLFYCAIIGKDRVVREVDISKKNKYIKKIELINKGGLIESETLTFSHGLNSIIGNSGSGKTMLLNWINLELAGSNLENAISSTKSNYDEMYKNTEVKIYDNNDELIKLGEVNIFEGENLYKQIVTTLTHDKENLLKNLKAMPLFDKTSNLIDDFNKNLSRYISERISIDNGNDLIEESITKIFSYVDYLRSNKRVPGSFEYIVDPMIKTELEENEIKINNIENDILLTRKTFDELYKMLDRYSLSIEKSNLKEIHFKLLKNIMLKRNDLKIKNTKLKASLTIKNKLSNLISEYNATIGQRTKTVNESKQNLTNQIEFVINQLKTNYYLKNKLEIPYLIEEEILNSVEKNDQIIKLENFKINKDIFYDDITEYFDSAIGGSQNKINKSEFASSKELNKNLYPINLFKKESVKKITDIFIGKKYVNSSIFKLIPEKFINYDIMIKNLEDNYQMISTLSAGQLSKIYINLLIDRQLETVKNNAIILYDQPDNNLEKKFILDILGKKLSELKKTYQIIITTHEPLLVINSDSNNIIIAVNNPVAGHNNIKYSNLTMYDVGDKKAAIDKIAELIDGSHEAIKKRNLIYGGFNL